MAHEDEILKELREHNRFLRAQIGLLSEIKFELQNARAQAQSTYKIKLEKCPSLWERFRYWLHGKVDN
jgi:hypothetical protein